MKMVQKIYCQILIVFKGHTLASWCKNKLKSRTNVVAKTKLI